MRDVRTDFWLQAIETLFPDEGLGGFRRHYPERPFVQHGALDRLDALSCMVMLDTPRSLIAQAPDDTLTTYVRCPDGAIRHVLLKREHAVTMYEHGMTVSIEGAQRLAPIVARWARALRRDLGYRPVPSGVALLVSPPGEAVPMHFDSIDVMIVHLRGTKRWTLAENTIYPAPDFSFFPEEAGGGAREPSGGNDARIPDVAWPTRMPEPCLVFEMRPGSVAFVPRGWWHMTHAETATISLTFKLPPTLAYEYVIGRLAHRLRSHSRWRGSIHGLWAASPGMRGG